MAGYETTGRVHFVSIKEVKTEKFTKRTVVLELDGTHPQFRSFQMNQTKLDAILPANIGQTVTLHWNMNGKKWTNAEGVTTYLNTDEVWKVDFGAAGAAPAPAAAKQKQPEQDPHPFTESDDDGLPF